MSKHFLDYLESQKKSTFVIGIDINQPEFDFKNYEYIECHFEKVDLLNKEDVKKILTGYKPNFILHLASYSSVAFSWTNPVDSFANNTNIFLNLIETVRNTGIKCRILSIGSSEEYGKVNENDLPLSEEQSLHPISPYAVARVSQEMLSKVYSESYGMDIILTRSFNHIGTHQKPIFVVASFCKQLVDLTTKNENKNIELLTGDTSLIRDFVDVRDVVRAYYLLFEKGKKGNVYNICSGIGTSLSDVINSIGLILNINVIQKVDSSRIRPNDIKKVVGSFKKLNSDTGWSPQYKLADSLKDIIAYFKSTTK